MKTFRIRLLRTIFAVCLMVAHAAVAADEPKDANWQSLFNGKDLMGWSPVHDVTFVVTNNNLQLVKGMGWLRTDKQFSDFIFEVEWRALVSDYDSGFFIRAGLDGEPWPKDAWQVNLKDNSLGGLVKGTKTMVPAETPRMPVGKWVRFRLEVRGKKLSLDVDGERAWEFAEMSSPSPPSTPLTPSSLGEGGGWEGGEGHKILDAGRGYIGIQAENKAFEFRNLRIQELPADGKPAR